MRVAIRTDASREIGVGHLMRCLALATVLRDTGAKVELVCREDARDLIQPRIKEIDVRFLGAFTDRAFTDALHGSTELVRRDVQETLALLGGGGVVDWLITDHYRLDRAWETSMRSAARRVMVIEDLWTRDHDCDLLLVQNLYDDMESLYRPRVPSHCRLLLGPRYALLTPQFLAARRSVRKRGGEVERILVGFGGADQTGQAVKAIHAIQALGDRKIHVDLVMGPFNAHRSEIEDLSRKVGRITLHVDVIDMVEIMMRADLAVGAAGVTAWERCCLRIPSLIVATADNQVPIAEGLHRAGAARYLGSSDEVSADEMADALRDILGSPNVLVRMGEIAASLVDGEGAYRVAESLRAP